MEQKEALDTARELYRKTPPVSRFLQSMRPYVCPFHKLIELTPEQASVLDIGCGAGLWGALLVCSGRASEVYGFDAGRAAVAAAEQMRAGLPEKYHKKLNFEFRKVEDGMPPGVYDMVSMIDLMHHVPLDARAALLRDALKSVRPGGLLLYKDIDETPLIPATMNRLHDLVVARQWIKYCPLENVIEWAKEAGATIVEQRRWRVLWYCHEVLVIRKPEN